MKLLLVGTALALALAPAAAAAAAAAAAEDDPVPTPRCAGSKQHTSLGTVGRHEDFAPRLVPSLGTDITGVGYHEESVNRFYYRLDVSDSPTVPDAVTANVSIDLTWDNDSDFDLFVYDAAGGLIDSSVNFNPLDGSGESLEFPDVAHCTDLRVDVVNYAGLPTTELDLDIEVAGLKPAEV